MGVPHELCEVQNALVGGGFGGKEDMTVQHHAALIAYLARVPVKVKLTRAESILIHPKRHTFDMDFTIGCDENGIIQGVKAKVVSDTGAFASLGGPVWNVPAPTLPVHMPMKILRSKALLIIQTTRRQGLSAVSASPKPVSRSKAC